MSIGKNMNIKDKDRDASNRSGSQLPVGQVLDAAKLQEINESVAAVSTTGGQQALKARGQVMLEEALSDSQKNMLIVFPVGEEEYAISIDDIKEVVPTPPIALIPQVPKYVRGVANVRGNVLAIIDLQLMFSKGDHVESDLGKFVLVIKSEEMQFAINAVSVPNTMIVTQLDIDPPTNIINNSKKNTDYVKGIIKKDKRMIIWIDILELMENIDISSE